ncbi:hypothetical protein DKX38_013683 [Salix brachista]|uniref:Uncharacterized protein n=1 Tax=Salix brachista TaxID=2182728 RepID=A0A5N5LDA7_9ROSI|nr:hypothetical protein DKX38_013683 [Salix brachista]
MENVAYIQPYKLEGRTRATSAISCNLVPPRTSGTENLALPYGEWEGYLGSDVHSSQFGVHEMMENNQVIIVGEGIVRLAAFTEAMSGFLQTIATIVVVPVCPHGVLQLGSSSADSFNQQIISYQAASRIVGRPSCSQPRQIQDNELGSSSAINIHNPDNPFMDQLANGVVGAEVIPSNPDSLAMSYVRTNGGHYLDSPAGSHISVQLPNEVDGVGIQNAGSSGAEEVHLSSLLGRFSASGILSGSSNPEYHPANVKHTENEISAVEEKVLPSGDDLYDILGISDRNMFSDMGTDHLLDAVVSRVHAAAKQIQMKMCLERHH